MAGFTSTSTSGNSTEISVGTPSFYTPPMIENALPQFESLNKAAAANLAQSITSEVANSITHGLGLLFSLFAATVLLTAARGIGGWPAVAYVNFVVTVIRGDASFKAFHLVLEV